MQIMARIDILQQGQRIWGVRGAAAPWQIQEKKDYLFAPPPVLTYFKDAQRRSLFSLEKIILTRFITNGNRKFAPAAQCIIIAEVRTIAVCY